MKWIEKIKEELDSLYEKREASKEIIYIDDIYIPQLEEEYRAAKHDVDNSNLRPANEIKQAIRYEKKCNRQEKRRLRKVNARIKKLHSKLSEAQIA